MEKKQTKYLITFYKSLFCLISIIFNINVLKAQTHSIILGRPTDVSITASILFDYNVSDGAIFGSLDTQGFILTGNGAHISVPLTSKDTLAELLLDQALDQLG